MKHNRTKLMFENGHALCTLKRINKFFIKLEDINEVYRQGQMTHGYFYCAKIKKHIKVLSWATPENKINTDSIIPILYVFGKRKIFDNMLISIKNLEEIFLKRELLIYEKIQKDKEIL